MWNFILLLHTTRSLGALFKCCSLQLLGASSRGLYTKTKTLSYSLTYYFSPTSLSPSFCSVHYRRQWRWGDCCNIHNTHCGHFQTLLTPLKRSWCRFNTLELRRFGNACRFRLLKIKFLLLPLNRNLRGKGSHWSWCFLRIILWVICVDHMAPRLLV